MVVTGLLAVAGLPARAEPVSDRQVIHVLDRLGFGPTVDDLRHVKAIGTERYIAEQLAPETIAEPEQLTERLAALDTLRLTPAELWERYGPPRPVNGVPPTPEERKARRAAAQIILQQARQARVLRAVYSKRQLQEVMVDFWYNHFNVFAGKGLDRLWAGAFEEQAIRPFALGRFHDLLLAAARHPAMLFYLDNSQNVASGTRRPNGTMAGLNENYARELMELHTLGVDGGYTQEDVVALARILTGWGLAPRTAAGSDRNGFRFNPANHDAAPKRFLGRDFGADGEREGIEAIEILARSPATAHHIAFKLAQYFVADSPPPALVDRIAARFQQSDGDIRATLQTLFASREFRDSAGGKYKTPYRYVLSAARVSGVELRNTRPLLGWMARLGMPLYGCQTPDGYQDVADNWLSPDATTLRVSFATNLASGAMPLATEPVPGGGTALAAEKRGPIDGTGLQAVLDPELSRNTRAVVAGAAPSERAALLLGSPDFMHR